jgi:hypothetical protein
MEGAGLAGEKGGGKKKRRERDRGGEQEKV